MTQILLHSLVPIFAVMALGYFAGWVRGIESYQAGSILIASSVLSAVSLAVTLVITGAG
jgi:hypothetical protein